MCKRHLVCAWKFNVQLDMIRRVRRETGRMPSMKQCGARVNREITYQHFVTHATQSEKERESKIFTYTYGHMLYIPHKTTTYARRVVAVRQLSKFAFRVYRTPNSRQFVRWNKPAVICVPNWYKSITTCAEIWSLNLVPAVSVSVCLGSVFACTRDTLAMWKCMHMLVYIYGLYGMY